MVEDGTEVCIALRDSCRDNGFEDVEGIGDCIAVLPEAAEIVV